MPVPTTDRSPWLLRPDVVFLNHGSFGACPAPVLAEQQAWRDRIEQEPIRTLDRELPGWLAEARATVGSFIGADPDGIAFLPNATSGVNTVVSSLRLEPGDEVLTADHEYNACLNVIHEAAARGGARVVVANVPFPIASADDEVVDAILAAVTPRTRLAVLSHVTSPTALVFPIETLVAELDRRGVDTIVDAAHAPGQVPLDVTGLGAAYWAGNGHKWLCAPKGTAVLWVREDRREPIRPLVISHGANDPDPSQTRFRKEFDWPGTTDPTGYLTMPAAIDFMVALRPGGWPQLMADNHELALYGRDLLCDALGIDPPAPDAMLGAMASLPLPNRLLARWESPAALQASLYEEDRIEVPIMEFPVRAARAAEREPVALLRISAQAYNVPADYEALASALRRRLA
jgi:isopenicillin-N epimerase